MVNLIKFRAMDKIELNFIINEIKKAEQNYFKKIYLHENGLFRIRLGENNILIKPGLAVWISEIFDEKSIENGFITKLRDKLSNRFLQKLYLKDGDRILVFEFNDLYLIIELFAKGNIILTDKEMKILEIWKKIDKKIYEFITEPFDLNYYLKIDENKPVGAVLSRMIGKKYKDFIIKKLEIDEKIEFRKTDIERIKDEIENLIKNAKPCIVIEDETILDFALNNYIIGKTEKIEHLKSLSESCSKYYLQKINEEKMRKKRTLNGIMEKIKKYKIEEIENRKKAEWIKNNIEIVQKIIEKSKNEDELKKTLEKFNIKLLKIDKKNKTIEIEISE